jgi:hypothetical protein
MPNTAHPEVLSKNPNAFINAGTSHRVVTYSGVSGAITLDLNAGSFFRIVNPTGNVTVTIPSARNWTGAYTLFVEVVGRGTNTVSFVGGGTISTINWSGGSAPTLASGTGRTLLGFYGLNNSQATGLAHFSSLA